MDRPPSSRGTHVDEDDELNSLPQSQIANLGVDQSALEIDRRAAAAGFVPAPWVPLPPSATSPSILLPLVPGGPSEGWDVEDTPPPAFPSFTSIGEATNALHRLAEFFVSADVPMATQPEDGFVTQSSDVELLSSAIDRLRSAVLGSAWADEVQWASSGESTPLLPPEGQMSNAGEFVIEGTTDLDVDMSLPPSSPQGSEGILPW